MGGLERVITLIPSSAAAQGGHNCSSSLLAPILQVRKRKWDNYSSGEELFGLTVPKFPELEQTEKEVRRLSRCASTSACQQEAA